MMKYNSTIRLILSMVLTLSYYCNVNAQVFEWVKQAGGTQNDNGYGISVDASGNCYVTGSFAGTATFGTIVLKSSGLGDIFVAKYDSNGNILWAKQAGGTTLEVGYGISVDASGNSYITGYFTGTATFGTIVLKSSGGEDIFIAKYDSNGNILWAKQAGGANNDNGFGISVDASGNSYITGSARSLLTFGDTVLMGVVNPGIFTAKYDTNGNLIWVQQATGGTDYQMGSGISVDTSGNSYITGRFSMTAAFGSDILVSFGDADILVAKYDGSGNFIWAKQAGGIFLDLGSGLSVDASGNSFVTGYFKGTSAFGTINLTSIGNNDIFIAKYDVNGNVLWAERAGGLSFDEGYGISVDASGNSYVMGYFNGTATFGTINLTSIGNQDIFVAKYDVNGNVIWAVRAGGLSFDRSYGISVDANGNTYVSGFFRETATFGNINLTSYGLTDIFIAKIENINTNIAEIILPQSDEYLLEENYPNPFNPSTTIKYQIPEVSFVTFKVYDVLGNEIETLVNEEKPAGEYEVKFSAATLPSGIYFYRLQAGSFVETKKMVLMK